MSTIFIAVQCCQCSTMQVKQQKKSSNKWNCVICNQKQSIRKVFAQGFLARDVRKFVQSFNMSCKFIEENVVDGTLSPAAAAEEIHNSNIYERKRRIDWTEYLDPEDSVNDNQKEQATDGGVSEPKIVTEFPKEMFKKPKLNNYSDGFDNSGGGGGGGANRLFKPNFSYRKKDKEEGKKEELQLGRAKGTTVSKWNNFLAEEDEDEDEDELLLMERGRKDLRDTPFGDQRVEDEVHPDFM